MLIELLFYLSFGKDDRYLCPFRNAVRSHYPDRTFIMECFFKDNIVNFCFSLVLLTLIRVHEHRCPPVHEHTHTCHRCPSSLLWVHDGCTMDARWVHSARWVHGGCILHDGCTMGAFCTMGARWVHSARWVHDRCILHDGYTMGAFCTMGA